MARALRTAVALGACLAVAGCGDGGEGASEVSLQLFGDAAELEVYRGLAAAYEKRTGNRVKLIEVADRQAHLQKLTTSFAGGSPPDAFLINYRNFGGYAGRKLLDPAGPRLRDSNSLGPEDFYEEALEAFTVDGQLQCMPQNVSSLVVYYNRDLFRGAGLKDPARDWSYQELAEAGHRLTDRPRRHGLGVEPGIVRAAPFVWSAGGELVDDPSQPTRYTLDALKSQLGLQFFLALAQWGPTEAEVESKSLDERFLDGELAMLMSSRREVPTLRTIKDFDWDVAPFPRVERAAGVLHSDAYCVTKGGDGDAAWRFVEFAVGPEGSRITAQGGRTVPSLKAVARSRAFLDPTKRPRSSQVFLDAIPTIRRLPNSQSWPAIEDATDLALEEAFYERGGPEAGGEQEGEEGESRIGELLARINKETRDLF
jgi:multiple sugar transport system substrate-binding protein